MAEKPKFYKGQKPLEVTAEMVFAAVQSIVDAGQKDEFLRLCKEKNATVTVSAEGVNFVKGFLFDRGSHATSMAARRVVESDQCTPG